RESEWPTKPRGPPGEVVDTAVAEPRAGGQRHAHRVVAERPLVQLPAERVAQRLGGQQYPATFYPRRHVVRAILIDQREHLRYPHAHTGCSKWSTRVGRPCITTSRS